MIDAASLAQSEAMKERDQLELRLQKSEGTNTEALSSMQGVLLILGVSKRYKSSHD